MNTRLDQDKKFFIGDRNPVGHITENPDNPIVYTSENQIPIWTNDPKAWSYNETDFTWDGKLISNLEK